jgi:hypothetical protein
MCGSEVYRVHIKAQERKKVVALLAARSVMIKRKKRTSKVEKRKKR